VRLALVDGSLLVYRDDDRPAAGRLGPIERLAVVVGSLLRVELEPPGAVGRRRDLFHGKLETLLTISGVLEAAVAPACVAASASGWNNTWRAVGEISMGKGSFMPRKFDAVSTGPPPAIPRGISPTQSYASGCGAS